jgi:hypothetical protein
MITEILSSIFGGFGQKILDIIDKHIEDKDLKNKLRAEIEKELINSQNKAFDLIKAYLDNQKEIIKAELNSDNWLAKSWRPLLALLFGFVFLMDALNINVLIGKLLGIDDTNILKLSAQDKDTILYMLSGAFMVSYGLGRTIEKISRIRNGYQKFKD